MLYLLCCMDWWSNWVDLARSSFGVLSVCPSKFVCSNNTIGTFYSFRMVSSCYCHIYCILCIVNYILMFILLFFSMHDWLYGMEQNLARSSFGVLSVFSNNMIIGIEHFNLVECWLVCFIFSLLYGLIEQLSRLC